MSNKTQVISFRLSKRHNRINCIRLIRATSELDLKGALKFVSSLEDLPFDKLVVRRSTFTELRAEMESFGLIGRISS